MHHSQIQSFEDLCRFLKEYTHWGEGPPLDVGGLILLLSSILDNLRENANEAELEEINGYLEPEQKAFLSRLSGYAQREERE